MTLRSPIALIFILALPLHVFGQAKKVVMSNQYDKNSESYTLIADNPFPGRRVIEVTFTRSANMVCTDNSKSFTKTIRQGSNNVSKIKKLDPNRQLDFGYTYRTVEGCRSSKPDFDYPYLIPLKQGNKTSAQQMSNLKEVYGAYSSPKDWYAISLNAAEKDTVYASRRGIVTKVVYHRDGQNIQGTSYSSKSNWMSIQHKDCTTARYELFADEGIWVKPGELVEVGQPLGVISSDNYNSGSHLRFSVFYYHLLPKLKNGQDLKENYYHAYVPVKFYTSEGILKLEDRKEYEVVLSPEMITKDMSKKEIKKWMKNN